MKKTSEVNLPHDFTDTIQNAFGPAGSRFLNSLPDLVNEASRRWDLAEIKVVPNLSYNFVAFAKQRDQQVVLKIGVPNNELISEITALSLFDGRGSVRLLEADKNQSMFLLERLHPGEMLGTLKDDELATNLAADVMLDLWQPAPANNNLILLSDWFKGFGKLRACYEGNTGPLDKGLVGRAEDAVREFFSEGYVPMLIHGDLHHFNILSSARGWLAIDPKGVIGPAAYEVGPLLINPWGELIDTMDTAHVTERRIAILSERLGFEMERIRLWGLAHAVLSAWWSLEANEAWEYAMKCARLLDGIK